jgi:hypothetical protein
MSFEVVRAQLSQNFNNVSINNRLYQLNPSDRLNIVC